MIDPSLLPSRQLRILARIARWILGLVLAFWLVLALAWGALHGFIVPRIGQWRADVERLATQSLGAPVRIQSMTAQSNGLFPTVHFTGITVHDGAGRQALMLDKVIATVSARSLLRLGLEQLYIDAPTLDIRHLADGRWQVAGIDVVQSDASESTALDWLLEQPELVIHKGRVHFTDEQRAMRTVELHEVDLLVRNRRWSHVVRLDATPVQGDGERMQLMGEFRQPWLPSSKAPWAHWNGQWYAALHLDQVPDLPWPQDWGVQALQANGWARAWVDIQHGKPTGVALDLALPQAHVQWNNEHAPDLVLQQLKGRLQAHWADQAWHVQAQDFSFRHADGGLWPSSNWRVSASGPYEAPNQTELALDYADLAMATKVVQSLPVPQRLLDALAKWTPQGQLRQLQLQWEKSGNYQARGHVSQLMLQPQPHTQGVGTPGLKGLNASFDLNAKGGAADIDMHSGVLHFPGVFEEPAIALDSLKAQVRWSIAADGRVKVDVPQAAFSNTDAQGSLHGYWQMGETEDKRLPGYLQLQGGLVRADGARVHRYLPLQVPEIARHYVRDSVHQGVGQKVEFEVKGNLVDMPFSQPGSGRFYIKAPVKDVVYAYVPASLHQAGTPAWPALTDLHGTLVFEGASMQVQQADTGFVGHPKVRISSVSAEIADFKQARLSIKALGHTDFNATLDLVKQSPLAGFTSHALDAAHGQGTANIAFELDLPLNHLHDSKVKGRIGFQHNALQLNASTPQLQQLQGAVQFHEQGFELLNVRGQALGGSFKAEGGMASAQEGVRVLARGTATALGMQKDGNIPVVAALAQHAKGQAAYSVEVTAHQGTQQVAVRSDLRGLALDVPAPLNKLGDEAQPLTVTQTLTDPHTQALRVDVGERGFVHYAQDTSLAPSKGVRGQIVVGKPALPTEGLQPGVAAYVALPALDVDAWMRVLQPGAQGSQRGASEDAQAWMPQRIHLQVQRLLLQERELEDVYADFTHTEGAWRGRLNAKHIAGTLEYHSAHAADPSGRLFARLSHLSIPTSEAQRLNHIPEPTPQAQVQTLPALDVEVEHLEVAGKSLGKLQLKARNTVGAHGGDWLLEQFNLSTPEARWRANGYWAANAPGMPRITQLSFLLEVQSSGKLLERFGMPGVIRDGQGRLSGNIAWQGAPITPQWHSMDGGIHMQMEKGQFLKVEPGMGKLLSVLSLQSLTHRMALDFRDVFSQGFAFDFVRGDISVEQGVARTNNLQMKGLNAAVLMEGSASLSDETQDLNVVVVPEINAMTASLAATAINPVIGVGSFVAQMLLRGPLMEAATRTFHVHGTWADPVVEPLTKKPAEPAANAQGVTP